MGIVLSVVEIEEIKKDLVSKYNYLANVPNNHGEIPFLIVKYQLSLIDRILGIEKDG